MKSKEINENKIIEVLVKNSSAGLDETSKKKILNNINIKLRNKYMKKYIFGSVSLLTLVFVGLFVFNTYLNKPEPIVINEVVAQLKTQDTSTGDASMKIAVDDHSSFNAAQNVLSFDVLVPTTVKGGQLAQVQTARTFDGSKSDSIYTTFAVDGDMYFQLNEMKTDPENVYVPEDSTKVTLMINGKELEGYYVKFQETDIDPNSEMALYGGTSSKSELSFYANGVQFSIYEFGKLTQNDLVSIANSLK